MTRLLCLSLVVALASDVPVQAQPKAPPKDFTNSIGMKFVWIPPGTFMMGSPKDEKKEMGVNETQHKVTLTKGFYMGVHLVTQEQWQTVMGNNPSQYKNEKNSPVENLSWDDCQKFIKKLREKDKKPYRLPTEAEWEYTCRAGTTTPFHFGETISVDQVNYNGNYTYGNGKKGTYRQKPTPVGSFPANAWGLHDMHGNLWQWCQDWYGVYPQQDVVDPRGPEKGDLRVLRGGAFNEPPEACRSASRIWHQPDRPGETIGFRVCFSLAPVDEGAESKDKIKDLLKERLATAAEAYEMYLKRLKEGNGHAVEVFQACKSLAQARLDLCETKEERIKACEQNLKEAEHFENITQKLAKGAQGTQADALMAKVLTLEAKIALEKAKLEK